MQAYCTFNVCHDYRYGAAGRRPLEPLPHIDHVLEELWPLTPSEETQPAKGTMSHQSEIHRGDAEKCKENSQSLSPDHGDESHSHSYGNDHKDPGHALKPGDGDG